MTKYEKATKLVEKIFQEARAKGISFIIFGGYTKGQLSFDSSDIDILCESRKDLDALKEISLRILVSNSETRIIQIRNSFKGFHLIFRIGDLFVMIDAQTDFVVEHLLYVNGRAVFALQRRGVNGREVLRAIKHKVSAKKAWPKLPSRLIVLRLESVGWIDAVRAYIRKGLRLLVGYLKSRKGVFIVLLGVDGSGKSSIARKIKEQIDDSRNIIPVYIFHLMPKVPLQRKHQISDVVVTRPHSQPPRGRLLSYIKLVYWLGRYWLGYLTSVRPLLVRKAIVIGDRYAYDLLIDPARYRFSGSLSLAHRIIKLIPRPDVLIIIDSSPEMVRLRKKEVPLKTLDELNKRYVSFVLKSPVPAVVIDGNQDLHKVVSDVLDEITFRLESQENTRLSYIVKSKIYSYLLQTLEVDIKHANNQCTHGCLYFSDGRCFLLPLDNRRVFARALEIYPAQSRKARLGKVGLRLLSRLGLKGPGLPRVRLEAQPGSVFQTLKQVFGQEDLVFAVSLGTPGPHRKPVVQVMTPEGEVLGYAKVGWNEATRALVKHEAEVLERLSREDLPFRVPRVLYANDDGAKSLVVQQAPPEEAQPAPRAFDERYLRVLQGFAARGVRHKSLEESPFWKRVEERIQNIPSAYWRPVLERAAKRVQEHWRDREVPFHFAHGDFTPWNALCAGETLYLYDWEYALEEAPAGYDLFHFLFQTAWLMTGKMPAQSLDGILEQISTTSIGKYWQRVGVQASETPWLLRLYLLDRLSFYALADFEDLSKRRVLGLSLALLEERCPSA